MKSLRLLSIFIGVTVLAVEAKAHGGEASSRQTQHPKIFRKQQHPPYLGPAGIEQAASAMEALEAGRRSQGVASPSMGYRPRLFSASATALVTASRRHRHHGEPLELLPSWMIRGGYGRFRRRRPEKLTEREEQERVRSVLLYYPNLIGYVRIVLVLASYYLAETNWEASSILYVIAFAGDFVDGHVARKFNQASRFGAVLDMATDRCSTAGLLLVLSRLYDHRYAFAFLVLMFVDIFSHWMHTHSVAGSHHKSTATLKRRNVLIRTYYDNLFFFTFCCIGTELLYVLLYLLHFLPGESRIFAPTRKLCFWLCLPACVLKQLINVAQIASAARTLALDDLEQRNS